MKQEDRDTDNVAAPKARRLLNKPVGPFEAHHADGIRRARYLARDEVEKSTDRQHQTRMFRTDMAMRPLLLKGRAHADDQHVDLLGIEFADDIDRIILVEIAIR